MSIKSTIRKSILGLESSNEYLCLPRHSLANGLKVYAKINGERIELTDSHILLGYKPLLLGIFLDSALGLAIPSGESLSLEFCSETFGRAPVATLSLRQIHQRKLGVYDFFVLEGKSGVHHFLNNFHQFANQIAEKLRRRKSGNVDLPGNLYDQVRIAYSVPRTISIFSLSDGNRFNFFPTDLHGPVGDQFYAGSLRWEGLANKQVEQFEKVALSNIRPDAFRFAYGLGKNHMRDLAPLEGFGIPFREALSPTWALPVPLCAVSIRELQRRDSFDAGIHRIHFYEVVKQTVVESSDYLAHVHAYYAQWRKDQRLSTNWLVR